MDVRTARDVSFSGRTVLVRVDFNVPMDGGVITSDRRIAEALPTLRYVIQQGARLVLMSHLGRPAGKGFEAEFSMAPVASRLSELLGQPVALGPPEVIGSGAVAAVQALTPGGVLLLENVRFSPGETVADKASKNLDNCLTSAQQVLLASFVAGLAELGDCYVNDAFGTCHRKHASMYGLPKAVLKKGGFAVAGFLVEREVTFLIGALSAPKKPFVAVLGGAKVSDKIRLIDSLLGKADRILVGGAMAYTLLRAQGHDVGRSRVEEDQVGAMKALLARAGGRILLPSDHIGTADIASGVGTAIGDVAIPSDLMGVDIGPATQGRFAAEIEGAGTVLWNGPMGVFETPAFAAGTRSIAVAMGVATKAGGVTVVGGGDSAAAVESMGLGESLSHISTGGGASLELIEGRPMPPLELLRK